MGMQSAYMCILHDYIPIKIDEKEKNGCIIFRTTYKEFLLLASEMHRDGKVLM